MDASENKQTPRSGSKKKTTFQIVGSDGSREGGITGFPGFIRVRDADTTVSHASHTLASKLMDFFPVNFRVGTDGYAYGFLFRLRRPADHTKSDVFLTYWNSKTAAWVKGYLVMEDTLTTSQMGVQEQGRFVYVFVSGRTPAMFYVGSDNSTLVTFGKLSTDAGPGPGKRPALLSYDHSYPMLTINSTLDNDRPGFGQIKLQQTWPSNLSIWPGSSGSGSSSHTGGSHSGSGNSGCSWDAPQYDTDVVVLEPGDYSFAYMLLDSRTGRRSALSDIATVKLMDFSVAVATYAYLPVMIELVYDSSKFDQAIIYRCVKIANAGGTYIANSLHQEAIINLETYWGCRHPSTTLKRAIYFYTLTDMQLTFKPVWLDREVFDETMPTGGEAGLYENTLFVSNIRNLPDSTTTEVRLGDAVKGLGETKWSATTELLPELFPPANVSYPKTPTSTIIRFRQAGGNLVGFSLDRQYLVRKEGAYPRMIEMHEGFGVTNSKGADSVGSMVYVVTHKGLKAVDVDGNLDDVRSVNYLLMQEWEGQLGQVQVAYDATVSVLWVFNPAQEWACAMWFNTASVSELVDLPFTEVRSGLWPRNPVDATDTLAPRALWAQDIARDSESEVVADVPNIRIYVMDWDRQRTITTSGGGFTGKTRTTLLDFTCDSRSNVQSWDDIPHQLTIGSATDDFTGLTVADINGAYVYFQGSDGLSGQKFQIKTYGVVGGGPSIYLTAIVSSIPAHIYDNEDMPYRALISPVYFRWVGGPVDMRAEDGTEFGDEEYFRAKHIQAISAWFTEVEGAAYDDARSSVVAGIGDPKADACFRGLVYFGDLPEGTACVYPTANGATNPYKSVVPYESTISSAAPATTTGDKRLGLQGTILAPGVEIFCPDLDFTMVSVLATGRILATARSRNTP